MRARRVGARGLQEPAEIAMSCRPGALTGRIFKQALSRVLAPAMLGRRLRLQQAISKQRM